LTTQIQGQALKGTKPTTNKGKIEPSREKAEAAACKTVSKVDRFLGGTLKGAKRTFPQGEKEQRGREDDKNAKLEGAGST